MKLKTSVKMDEENITFWKKMNINGIKSDIIKDIMSYSDLQKVIIYYFKINNDRYIELLELLDKVNKNGYK